MEGVRLVQCRGSERSNGGGLRGLIEGSNGGGLRGSMQGSEGSNGGDLRYM